MNLLEADVQVRVATWAGYHHVVDWYDDPDEFNGVKRYRLYCSYPGGGSTVSPACETQDEAWEYLKPELRNCHLYFNPPVYEGSE